MTSCLARRQVLFRGVLDASKVDRWADRRFVGAGMCREPVALVERRARRDDEVGVRQRVCHDVVASLRRKRFGEELSLLLLKERRQERPPVSLVGDAAPESDDHRLGQSGGEAGRLPPGGADEEIERGGGGAWVPGEAEKERRCPTGPA